jgi:hypothetical protein
MLHVICPVTFTSVAKTSEQHFQLLVHSEEAGSDQSYMQDVPTTAYSEIRFNITKEPHPHRNRILPYDMNFNHTDS